MLYSSSSEMFVRVLEKPLHKWQSRENLLAYKKAKNIWDSLSQKAKSQYFRVLVQMRILIIQKFWKTVKPFFTLKLFVHNETLLMDISNKIVKGRTGLTKKFSSYYTDQGGLNIYNFLVLRLRKVLFNQKNNTKLLQLPLNNSKKKSEVLMFKNKSSLMKSLLKPSLIHIKLLLICLQ